MSEITEDAWAMQARDQKPRSESAFGQPTVLEAETNDEHGDGDTHQYQHEHDTHDADHEHDAGEDQPNRASKPNYTILAVVGVLTLSLLGGVGYVVKNKLTRNAAPEAQKVQIYEMPIAPASPAPPASPFASNTASSSPNPNSASDSSSTPAIVGSTTTEPALSASANSAVVASVTALPVTSGLSAQSPAAPAQPVVKSPTVVVVTPSATIKVMEPSAVRPGQASTTATPVVIVTSKAPVISEAAPATSEATATPARKARVGRTFKRMVAVAEPRKHAIKGRKLSRSTVAANARASKANKNAKMAPVEEYLLPRATRVLSIYPSVGKDVQAWISDGSGKVEVVRIGDSLRSGPSITGIVAEKGEVITSSGTITTRGVR